jgi:two-component system, NtrC family, sensor kinase
MTSTIIAPDPPAPSAGQWRPTGAKLRGALSLRVRLAILVALCTAVVIGVESLLEIRVFENAVERDLFETARVMAVTIADDYELRAEPVDTAALTADLHELVLSAPMLRTLTIVRVNDATPTVIASTSSGERTEALDLALQAVRTSSTSFGSTAMATTAVAVPVTRADGTRAAAVVTVSLNALQQLRTKGRQVTFWFTPAAIVLLTLLVDWLARRLIHRPIRSIRDTMVQAGDGDFTARAEQVRPDEIGAVAAGLNDMLKRLQDFHEALQDRVDEATSELRIRNEELIESYKRVLALREALARTEQLAAVGQMAASVAHQVGTPLNLISGYVQMLQEDASDNPKTAERLVIVQEQIAKVASVVRTLLDQSRRPAARAPAALESLLLRVADVARPKLDASGIELTLDIEPNLPPIWADSEQLELAMLNLITNSLDAMPSGGALAIQAARAAEGVRIEITDTGTGIPTELLPRIFLPWVTTKPAGRGTGLGLSITHDVVQRHGGTISVVSDHGRGTTFTIDLPESTQPETVDVQNSHR